MPKTTSINLDLLKKHHSDIQFVESDIFYWAPQEKTIYFNPEQLALKNNKGIFQLLHEVGHAKCNHTSYRSGIELMKMEVAAWEEAHTLAKQYGIEIKSAHIEKCLNSYRDWLHLRSTCPKCSFIAVEINENQYRCFNCLQHWGVPENQQTRQYRLKLSAL